MLDESAHHHAIGREALQLVVVDDGAAGVLGDDAHGSAAVDAIAADHGPGTDHVHIRLVRVDEVIALNQHRDVARPRCRRYLR